MARKRTVIGNWKMQGSKAQISAFFKDLEIETTKLAGCQFDAAICVPFVYLSETATLLQRFSNIALGAQDVSAYPPGAYTGQVAASMLKEQGCRYVIVGHSERRQFCHESEVEIADKFIAAKGAGLIPILCVGESKTQREGNLTAQIVTGQLQTLLARLEAEAFEDAIIAYEPMWAIGTGVTATPEQAEEVHRLIRQTVAGYDAGVAEGLLILYGGSVKPSNASALFAMPNIDGALVGGASLKAAEFLAIIAG